MKKKILISLLIVGLFLVGCAEDTQEQVDAEEEIPAELEEISDEEISGEEIPAELEEMSGEELSEEEMGELMPDSGAMAGQAVRRSLNCIENSGRNKIFIKRSRNKWRSWSMDFCVGRMHYQLNCVGGRYSSDGWKFTTKEKCENGCSQERSGSRIISASCNEPESCEQIETVRCDENTFQRGNVDACTGEFTVTNEHDCTQYSGYGTLRGRETYLGQFVCDLH